MKKKAFGIVLLVLAAWNLAAREFWNSFFGWQDMAFTRYCFFAYKTIESILRRHLTSACFYRFTGAHHCKLRLWLFASYQSFSHLASILVVLGVGYLTHSSKFWNEKKWWYNGKKTVVTDKEVAFGSGTFYKQDQDLVDDQVEVAFGGC